MPKKRSQVRVDLDEDPRTAPRFISISDRQLDEALALLQREISEEFAEAELDSYSVQELTVLASARAYWFTDILRMRLGELLGFPDRGKKRPKRPFPSD